MTTILIPMAGLGTRFSQVGYKLLKSLISVSGKPMILNVIKDLPKANKWIFVMRQEHIDYGVDKIIKREIPNAIIIAIDKTTEGQACTCMLAEKYLDLDDDLIIASCDIGFLYNKNKFDELREKKDVDCIVLTFTKRETLRRNPNAWGWYILEDDNETIKDISIKVPVSNNSYNDHAVVGTFYFKKAKYFIDASNLMIKENYRTNNEFYVDSIPKFLKKIGKKSIIFDVDLFVGWGKPDDLYDYERIEFIIKNNVIPLDINEEEKRLLPLWKKYFKK
ncbi:MAG: nucleotidyltransferase [Candidatus Woesearchaeota archaeon]